MLHKLAVGLLLVAGSINAATSGGDRDRYYLVYVLQEMVYAKTDEVAMDRNIAGKRILSTWGGEMGENPWSTDLTIGEILLRNDEKNGSLLATGDGFTIRFEFGGSGSYFRNLYKGLPVGYVYVQYWIKVGDKSALVHIVGKEWSAIDSARDIIPRIVIRHAELKKGGNLDQVIVRRINEAK